MFEAFIDHLPRIAVPVTLLSIGLVFQWKMRKRRLQRNEDERNRKLLAHFDVIHVEHKVRTTYKGITVNGRIDEVRRAPNKQLVVYDNKTRAVSPISRLERVAMSLYAWQLAVTENADVAEFGVVRFIDPVTQTEYLQPVMLLTRQEVEAIIDQYVEVRRGRIAPKPALELAKCRNCAHAIECLGIYAAPGVPVFEPIVPLAYAKQVSNVQASAVCDDDDFPRTETVMEIANADPFSVDIRNPFSHAD